MTATVLDLDCDTLGVVCTHASCYTDVARLACACRTLAARLSRPERYRVLQRDRIERCIDDVTAAYVEAARTFAHRYIVRWCGCRPVRWLVRGNIQVEFLHYPGYNAIVGVLIHRDARAPLDAIRRIIAEHAFDVIQIRNPTKVWAFAGWSPATGDAHVVFERLIRAMATMYARRLPLEIREVALRRIQRRTSMYNAGEPSPERYHE